MRLRSFPGLRTASLFCLGVSWCLVVCACTGTPTQPTEAHHPDIDPEPDPNPIPDATSEPDANPDAAPDPDPDTDPEPVACVTNADCAEDQVCECTDEVCGGGVCAQRPTECPEGGDGVCGCDGIVYANACLRQAAGVCGAPVQRCEVPEGPCTDNSDCDTEELCELPEAQCGGEGECVPRPVTCPEVISPVCGCDGFTWSNDCVRRLQGVGLHSLAPCEGEQLRCESNEDCTEAQLCDCGEACGATGLCLPRPEECPPTRAPVCGCDGITYINDCVRRDQQTCLAAEGECEGGGCLDNQDCAGSEFCEIEPGTCGQGPSGECRARPLDCPQVAAPVCGCDGQNYDNACAAQQAGVSILSDGLCPVPPRRCESHTDCRGSEYCDCSTLQCGAGGCRERPVDCPEVLDPVCGCDEVTYDNDCLRREAGVCLLENRPCPRPQTLCRSARDCAESQVCIFEQGTCEELGGEGVCTERLECPPDVDPVCGCDGVTYTNICEATNAGISVDRPGACPANEDTCETRADCDAAEFCDCAIGVCGAAGVCRRLPSNCPEDPMPVCGCDGVTYTNDCERQQAGVCVELAGTCDGPPPDGCRDNGDCPTDTFCEFELNTCDEPDRRGECQPRESICSEVDLDPVCGCDGVTYISNCERRRQGVPLLHRGTCGDPIRRCHGHGECREGEFCECFGVCGFIGRCRSAPESCSVEDFDPVCGCDGVTYDNDCERQLASTCLLDIHPCDDSRLCGRRLDRFCPPGAFCDLTLDSCGDVEAIGLCEDTSMCNSVVFDPVCACDGRTFDNDCLRMRAGSSKAFDGPCDPRDLACEGDGDCGAGQFCDREGGTCNEMSTGICEGSPEECGNNDDPVCGCDGVTYTNDCHRRRARVPLDTEGPCR